MNRALSFFIAPDTERAAPAEPRPLASDTERAAPAEPRPLAPDTERAAPAEPRPLAPPPRTRRKRRSHARPRSTPLPTPDLPALAAPARVVTGAAVVGRPREAEPVAAALALALRRETRAKAATVAVIGPPLPEGAGGGGAGRRLAARLAEQGLDARVRGRLTWVRLDPAAPDLAALAWRVALMAAPVVFVVTVPRTAAIDAALADQDLIALVTADPDGPLAAAATSGLDHVVPVRPLRRGLARELSRAGLCSAPAIRRLLAPTGQEAR